ncbi:MAG TPA: Sua5/YciO/YrdC/YwlC family protein [Mariprofundaceae bacterium]|nr:Sua5/YciO/YrdC/YwlC family protein [Mariprofundaceae bacterium]
MAGVLRRGGLIGHYTSTLPGVACSPKLAQGIKQMQRFKKRHGPFLLLADSIQTARGYIRWYPSGLRKLIKSVWPGQTTLVIPARPGLPSVCYQKGMLAIRVDADLAGRGLARACGGLLLSSSLNRRGGTVRRPCYAVQMRWHRFLSGRVNMGESSGNASTIYRIDHRGSHKLR